eukprot:353375-Chlamydomonas_euryale.AAC.7
MERMRPRSTISRVRSLCTRSSRMASMRSRMCGLRTTWSRHSSRPSGYTGVFCCWFTYVRSMYCRRTHRPGQVTPSSGLSLAEQVLFIASLADAPPEVIHAASHTRSLLARRCARSSFTRQVS